MEPLAQLNDHQHRGHRPAPFGVYVHFPYCRAKCGYCDFASIEAVEIPHRAYADVVVSELEARAPDYAEGELHSVYFGGGTPSLWDSREVGRVLGAVLQAFDGVDSPEVTVEANPGTVDGAGLSDLVSVGVTRLSLGVQSLDDEALRLLGRIHSAEDARRSMRDARRAGFGSVSVDLMFGLPGQTLAHHLEQLQRLLDLAPDHLSAYALSLSPDAPLRRAGFSPAPDDLQADMMRAGRALLEEAGLPQYEVSNFAPPRRRSVHNQLCWTGWPYLGLGASAHSMSLRGPQTVRVANPPLPDYLTATRGPFPAIRGARIELVPQPESRNEVLFLGLRTSDGVDRAYYRRRFGTDILEHYGSALEELRRRGLIHITPSRIAPTAEGIWFADELAVRLMA